MKYKVHQLVKLNGNPIFAGIYDATELPDRIKDNPNLATKLDDDAIKTASYQTAAVTQNITVGTKTGITGLGSFDPKPAVDADLISQQIFDPNSATLDELSSLDGVTVAIAQQIIDKREKQKFVDFDDLDKRVPLKSNRKWTKYGDRLNFLTN